MENLRVRAAVAATTAALAVLLSSCGSAPSPPMLTEAEVSSPQKGAPALRPNGQQAHTGRVLFVSNLDGNIHIYSADIHESNPPLLGTLTQGATHPQGVWIDRKDTLYVVNSEQYPTQANVVEYKRGASSPFRTITDGVLAPGAVAVGRDGTVYVNTITELDAHVVVVYAPGATTPEQTITLTSPQYGPAAGGMAFDPQGNLLVATFGNADEVHVFKIAPGSSQATDLGLQGTGGDAIAVDGAGNLYAGGGDYFVAVYPPGATSPSRTIPNGFAAYGLTATSNGTLYIVGDDVVAEYPPGASKPINTIDTLYGETFTFDAAIGLQ